MTQSERPFRDSLRSALPQDPLRTPDERSRSQRRLLLAVLVVLAIVLAILIALVLKGSESPAPINMGPVPRVLLAIPGPGTGDAPLFRRPLAVAWSPDGDIYVSDTGNRRICVFSDKGRFKREFGGAKPTKKGAEKNVIEQPGGIAFDLEGNVYVADIRGGEVVVFSPQGKLIKRLHRRTTGGDQQPRWTPTDVAVSGGRVYVTDSDGVSIFSVDGTAEGRIEKANGKRFARPNGVAVRPNGNLVISDTNNGRIVALEGTGTLEWTVGPTLDDRRIFGLPRGLAIAQDGSALIADAFLFGIVRLTEQGERLNGFGGRGAQLGLFEFPNDVDVRGELVVVADKENNRVQLIQWPGLLSTAGQ